MSTPAAHKPYPSDVSDDEWEFVAPYLTLMTPDALQRTYALRDVFDAVRWLVRTGAPWRYLPGDFPPWPVVYQQARRWLDASCFEALVHDLQMLLRVLQGRAAPRRRPRPFWTPASCNRVPKAGSAPATTGTSTARGPRCMRRSIRWAICWR